MFKRYKRQADGSLLYREAWAACDMVTEHWGTCGTRGEIEDHAVLNSESAQQVLDRLESAVASNGFEPIPIDDMVLLIIEYPIEGHGSAKDLERRHALEDAYNDLIGWLGLGQLDGGSIGSGSMEIALLVVDFDTAKAALEANVAGTEMDGFSQIYQV
jgi:hypothetical protein